LGANSKDGGRVQNGGKTERMDKRSHTAVQKNSTAPAIAVYRAPLPLAHSSPAGPLAVVRAEGHSREEGREGARRE
jgi:hypothetical protein